LTGPDSSKLRRLAPLLAGAALALSLIGAGLWWAIGPSGDHPSPPTSPTSPTPEPPPGMVYVMGGELMMGNDAGDEYERPAHRVTVNPFFIDRHEVAVEDYQKFVMATGRAAPQGWPNGVAPPGAARRPITGVNWDDAVAYARWAGKRLPTEAEWEFAARGAGGRRYPWGDEWRPGYANADATSINHLADVESHSAGAAPCGAINLVGNAWEWTASDLTAYPGGQLKIELAGDLKVIRGGAWSSDRQVATTTYRRGYPARGSDYSNTGFRCAKDFSESQR
jgi:iron(II)-dependent oxidoreductase